MNNIYHHPTLPPLKINSNTLQKLLLLCSTEVPFYNPHRNIFIQKDGIMMGSVLGPIFSNFYMLALENKVFDTTYKLNIYLKYADNILLTNSTDEINIIQEIFQNNSVLNFTQEININNKIPFLGVLIDTSNIDQFITSTYKKPTNINPCALNFQSECPFHYKRTIIKTLIFRAKLLSSSWTIFLNKLKNIKQILINNGFPNYIVDTEIEHFINKTEQHNIDNTLNHKQSINLNYKNQFHNNFKIDEHILKNLIWKNILPSCPTKKVRLIIYYNKFKTSNLIISNNTSPSTKLLDGTNIIYMFKYPLGECVSKENYAYVGFTTTTLSRWLTMHLNDSNSIALYFNFENNDNVLKCLLVLFFVFILIIFYFFW